MTTNPYSQYGFYGNFTHTVGMFCSLLYNNKLFTTKEIDEILSEAELFKNIENLYNPLLLTSNEQVWFPIFLQDKKFSQKLSAQTQTILRNLSKRKGFSFDWFSVWAGSMIASLAIRYDVPMRKIVSIMSFEEFMEYSVALHAQPDDYMFENFKLRVGNNLYLSENTDAERKLNEYNNICILEGDERKLLLSCFGLLEDVQNYNNKIIVASDYSFCNTEGFLGTLGALFPNKDVSLSIAKIKSSPNLKEISNDENIQTILSNEYDGLKIPNWLGSWNKYRIWYENRQETDRGKYLVKSMSYIMLLKPEWCEENFQNTEKVTLSGKTLKRIMEKEAQKRDAFALIPFSTKPYDNIKFRKNNKH